MKKKRMEYCEVISYLLPYDWIDNPKNTLNAKWGYLPQGDYTLIDDPTLPSPPSYDRYKEEISFEGKITRYEKVYYEARGARERAFVFYGTNGYVKKFELDSEGNTLFFPSALDAVNYLAAKGWFLDKTFKSSTTSPSPGRYFIFEHWVMSREIDE